MDISHDSKLIVTCSADKNVKIWGLDFGDCHKSIFAHEESVMQVAFEKGSHYFWTVSKDRMLKYWDGDKVRYQCHCHPKSEIHLYCLSSNVFKSSTVITERYGLWLSATMEILSSLARKISQSVFTRNLTNLCVYLLQEILEFFTDVVG